MPSNRYTRSCCSQTFTLIMYTCGKMSIHTIETDVIEINITWTHLAAVLESRYWRHWDPCIFVQSHLTQMWQANESIMFLLANLWHIITDNVILKSKKQNTTVCAVKYHVLPIKSIQPDNKVVSSFLSRQIQYQVNFH